MKKTIKYLRKNEWSMGNGQCPICCGPKPRRGWWTDKVGHKKDCKLAECLNELGENVIWERKNHSKKVIEHKRFIKKMVGDHLLKYKGRE